jgi:hypothetical protein
MTSTIKENNFVGLLLKPLLKRVTPIVGSRLSWRSRILLIVAIHDGSQKENIITKDINV